MGNYTFPWSIIILVIVFWYISFIIDVHWQLDHHLKIYIYMYFYNTCFLESLFIFFRLTIIICILLLYDLYNSECEMHVYIYVLYTSEQTAHQLCMSSIVPRVSWIVACIKILITMHFADIILKALNWHSIVAGILKYWMQCKWYEIIYH